MTAVHKTVFLKHSPEKMFALVSKVEDYPEFLPWCSGVDIHEHTPERLVATLDINYHGIKQSFTTENTNLYPESMRMRLIDGPFKHLDGNWRFKKLRSDACKIDFYLHYEFSNRFLEKIISPVFDVIANSFTDSFCKRADAVYNS
jgi:ribosome-associated toxin RatA of RatAB toxin-antitoxin module